MPNRNTSLSVSHRDRKSLLMILEILFTGFIALAVFFAMRALRALIIRRWIEDALKEGVLIEEKDDADRE